MAGVGKLLKQAQKMQKKIEAIEAEMAEKVIEVSSGGGAIKVSVACSGEVRKIELDPEFLQEDKELIEETLVTAVQDALNKAKEEKEAAMSEVTTGFQMPGFM